MSLSARASQCRSHIKTTTFDLLWRLRRACTNSLPSFVHLTKFEISLAQCPCVESHEDARPRCLAVAIHTLCLNADTVVVYRVVSGCGLDYCTVDMCDDSEEASLDSTRTQSGSALPDMRLKLDSKVEESRECCVNIPHSTDLAPN